LSFWKTSNGQEATGEVQENNFDPLPDAYYPTMQEEVKINEYQGERTIQFKTRVIGEGFGKNRVLFLKLKAFDEDEKKRDRAINLLVKLANTLGVPLPKNEPDDTWLSKLTDKPHQTKLQKFDFKADDGKQITGNFIANFEDLKYKPEVKGAVKAGPAKAAPKAEAPQSAVEAGIDDDIPF
jgi:hypothetical protein